MHWCEIIGAVWGGLGIRIELESRNDETRGFYYEDEEKNEEDNPKISDNRNNNPRVGYHKIMKCAYTSVSHF